MPEEPPTRPGPAHRDESAGPVRQGRRIAIAPSSIVLAGGVFWSLFLVGLFVARFIDVLLTIFLAIIYAHSVHIHPLLVVVALLFGGVTFGVLGALVAVPVAAALQVAVENLYIKDLVASDRPPPGPNL